MLKTPEDEMTGPMSIASLTDAAGRAIAEAVCRWLPTRVVDEVTLGQVFSKYFGFPCQSSFHKILHNHHHLSSGAGTIRQ
jgi:hypothetical protein